MKFREAATTLALAGALTSCTSSANSHENQATPTPASLHFLAEAKDSDAFRNINCEQYPTAATVMILDRIDDYAGRHVQVLTLGDSKNDQNIERADPATVHFLGGITIRIVNGHTIDFVTSADPQVHRVNLDRENIAGDIPVNDTFGLRYSSAVLHRGIELELSCLTAEHVPGTAPQTKV